MIIPESKIEGEYQVEVLTAANYHEILAQGPFIEMDFVKSVYSNGIKRALEIATNPSEDEVMEILLRESLRSSRFSNEQVGQLINPDVFRFEDLGEKIDDNKLKWLGYMVRPHGDWQKLTSPITLSSRLLDKVEKFYLKAESIVEDIRSDEQERSERLGFSSFDEFPDDSMKSIRLMKGDSTLFAATLRDSSVSFCFRDTQYTDSYHVPFVISFRGLGARPDGDWFFHKERRGCGTGLNILEWNSERKELTYSPPEFFESGYLNEVSGKIYDLRLINGLIRVRNHLSQPDLDEQMPH